MTQSPTTEYEVIVVGGGHAGCEAAWVSAQMGLKTLLITLTIHGIALMPCNPAIGGPGKGQVVREIDALGGLMAQVTDQSTIHLRRVNTGKGPAVQTLRAQTMRDLYSLKMRERLENNSNLSLFQGEVEEILLDSARKVKGVRVQYGTTFWGKAVVLAIGTFLNGVIRLGSLSFPAGRHGEFPAQKIGHSLEKIGLKLGKLNTCTSPRLDRRTIDFSQMEEQPSEEKPLCFSFEGTPRVYQGASIFITRTTQKTCQIIKRNLDRSPLLYPVSDSSPVRECPSLEDKVCRFPDRESHPIFLEPEGPNSNEIYCQGVFTSLPEEVQWQIIHSIPGLEKTHIMRPGYGIEYNFVFPNQLKPTLECQTVTGLFLAGQINGTSGYEEAAGQGVLAGINAGRYVQNLPPLVLRRDQSYIGVMVDDLITKGVEEPYRLRTGKVEYRLMIRHSNADLRLTEVGYHLGIVPHSRYQKVVEKREGIEKEISRLKQTTLAPTSDLNQLLREKGTTPINEVTTLYTILSRPQVSYYDLQAFDPFRPFLPPQVIEEVEIEIKYRGYIERQKREVEEFLQLESKKIPPNLDFYRLKGISREAQERLAKARPTTLGQASRVQGVTPSDLVVLSILLERKNLPLNQE
ncbi:MAG: tRNA uridine 5-carboxymethylaminomethyl modification enzyme [Candidatus Atribacteria bacterium]|nr:tRNA uridine 5-carboxymethylaminomethyl modification enzyme [Candidatus Atribacteria bacterium]